MDTITVKIPKIIHYCWFGGKSKPKLVRDCIRSWKKYLSDYEIIEWNEENSDLTHPFVKEAYQLKKWAFVADYIRLEALYKKGGIYLDTDMMVVKSLNSLLGYKCFLGAEDSTYINAAIIGTVSKNDFIEECLKQYNAIDLAGNSKLDDITIPKLITNKFNELSKNRMPFDKIISHQDITIFPPEYFYALPFEHKKDLKNYKNYISNESYSVHLWQSSWIEFSEFYYFAHSEYSLGLRKVINKIKKDKKVDLNYIRRVTVSIIKSVIKFN